MRNIAFWIAVIGLVSCGRGNEPNSIPTTPSTFLPAPVAPQPPQPAPAPSPGLFEDAIPLAFGATVTDSVADDDPACGSPYVYRCRYFRIAVPRDGELVVTIRWNFPASYPFDLGVYGPTGSVADGKIGVGLERTARGRVSGGATYVIEVWSFLTPSGSFELTTSIDPR